LPEPWRLESEAVFPTVRSTLPEPVPAPFRDRRSVDPDVAEPVWAWSAPLRWCSSMEPEPVSAFTSPCRSSAEMFPDRCRPVKPPLRPVVNGPSRVEPAFSPTPSSVMSRSRGGIEIRVAGLHVVIDADVVEIFMVPMGRLCRLLDGRVGRDLPHLLVAAAPV